MRGARAFQQRAHIQLRGESLTSLACTQMWIKAKYIAAENHAADMHALPSSSAPQLNPCPASKARTKIHRGRTDLHCTECTCCRGTATCMVQTHSGENHPPHPRRAHNRGRHIQPPPGKPRPRRQPEGSTRNEQASGQTSTDISVHSSGSSRPSARHDTSSARADKQSQRRARHGRETWNKET